MANKWYVVHTMSGQERKVKANLEARIEAEEMGEFISRVLIPTENVSEVKAGKKRISTRLFYPGYILVEMEMADRTWHFVRQTGGVLGFLGDKDPIPLLNEEVQEVLGQIEDKKEKVKPKVMFEVGETVKVTEGPFVNFNGVIEESNPEKGKLRVMVTIFGRSTPVELEYWQVERT
jgi:transcriptional antiterminator NusG